MIVDVEKVASVIAEIAAEEIAPRFGKLKDSEIGTKSGPNDFVTQADERAEAALAKALCGIDPGAAFVGEESVAGDPAILETLKGDGPFWIVDPLDGTRNFVQGRDEFATIVAYVAGGEIRAGWIYAIPQQTCAVAEAGEGAAFAGKRLGPLARNDGALSGYRAIGNLKEPYKSAMVPRLRAKFHTDLARCSAYVYLHLLTGDCDFALYSRCSPWDHAAGVLMLREIKGRAEYLDTGRAYAPIATQGRPLLVVGETSAFDRVSAALTGA